MPTANAAFEEYTMRCQQIIAREGNLHIASVAPLTRYVLCRALPRFASL
jgi:hypothetical protein